MKTFNIFNNVGIILSCIVVVTHAKLAMIIRHGEKISDSSSGLSSKGMARAYCLVNAFGNNGTYATPEKIYAQSPTEKQQSTRPRDTVEPLAKILNIQLTLSYTSGQIKKLTKNIMNTSEEVVLVSWSNDNIPEIAEKFGINSPPYWNSEVFDDIWMIYDQATPSFYKVNKENKNLEKQQTYTGNEGYTLEIVKENIEDCINENIDNFKNLNNTDTSDGPTLSLYTFMKVMTLLIILYITF